MPAPISAGNFVASGPVPTERAEPRWRVWGRSAFALVVVVLLAGLGIANIAMHGKWHEVEDGAFWAPRAEGITAVEVVAGSPAALAGIRAVVVMPATAVSSKVDACRAYGAEVVLHGATTVEAWADMERLRDAGGLTFIHPFDHPVTIAGQGPVGLEILADLPDVDLVVVSVGGGGLACGIATALATRRPTTRVWGVEPASSAALSLALAANEIVPVTPGSVADGLNAPFAGDWTLALGRRHLAGIVTLSDPEILGGVRFAAERMKQVLEPAGAASLAAVLHGRIPLRDGDRVCVVLSGGNVALDRLGELLAAAAPIPGL